MAGEATIATSAPRLSPSQAALLRILASGRGPYGAREATRRLRDAGAYVSESTVARALVALDRLGLSVALDGRGRAITPLGRAVAEGLGSAAPLAPIPDATTITDIVHLLSVRQAISTEAAREAALNASRVDLAQLQELLDEHQHRVEAGASQRHEALEFHRGIARSSHNPFLDAVMRFALNLHVDKLEAVLDVIIGARRTQLASVEEHREILKALRSGDPARSAEAMSRHLERLKSDVVDQAQGPLAPVVERFLMWLDRPPSGKPSGDS